MDLDRRKTARCVTPRRGCERLPIFQPASWKQENDGEWRSGLLVSVSGAGIGMLTEHQDTPLIGSRIRLRCHDRVWQKSGDVVRVDHLAGTMDLVAAEFTSSVGPGNTSCAEALGAGGEIRRRKANPQGACTDTRAPSPDYPLGRRRRRTPASAEVTCGDVEM